MKKKLSLTTKIFIGLIVGFIAGLIVNQMPESYLRDTLLIKGIFQLVGQVFLRSIMMLVVPLVFITIVNGVLNMGDVKRLGRIGGKTLVFYMCTTAIAIIISLALASLLPPAAGVNLGNIDKVEVVTKDPVPLVDILTGIIPKNSIAAFAEGNMLQIIAFAIIMGIGISLVDKKAPTVRVFFEEMNHVMLRLIKFVMSFASVGVFGLIAKTFGELGWAVVVPVAKYVGLVYLGLLIHVIIIYGGLLKLLAGVSPRIFFKKFVKVMSVAFSTASSNATLPLNMEVTTGELGVNSNVASFTLPLGATINMDGTAIMQGVATLFIAQAYGIQLTPGQMLTVVLTATLASIGTAGVPGAGALMLSLVLQSIGLPLDGMGLILGVDRLVDMGRTSINITGDAVCSIVIAKQEKQFDEKVYRSESKTK